MAATLLSAIFGQWKGNCVWNSEKKTHVSFGTTTDREIFPSSVPHNRLASDLNPIRGAPNRGPGCYENEQMTNMWRGIENKLVSTRGYVLGARTAPRFAAEYTSQTPAPTAYQYSATEPKAFTPEFKPFKSGTERLADSPRGRFDNAKPGPGCYEHEVKRNRHVQWHQSFGGSPINIPTASHKSTVARNTDKLFSTIEEKRYQRRLAYLKLYYD